MSAEIEAYIESLDSLRRAATEVIRGMSAEELGWAPLAADTNSPTVLATHMAGSEGFWVQQVVGGIDVRRDRDAEFVARDSTAAELEAMLERTGRTSRDVLRGLSGTDLGDTRPARTGEDPVSVRHAILHQIEHMALHLGHLALTHQLYEARDR
jgi:hypothetical protein